MNLNSFIAELKRRNVFRVGTAYAIAGWLIIQIVTTVSEPLSLPDWFDTATIIVVLIGLPVAMIIAWAFELTPEGLKKSDDVEITESVTAATGKKINRIIIAVLSISLIFLLTERVFFAESTILDRNKSAYELASIAVLPFADLSPEGDQEYFSDGLSEELLNVLAKEEKMKVAGRTSSFKFKGMNEDIKLIGEQLGVEHILEGSVRKAGNRLRITAQLIKVEDGFNMWSETYDREYTTESIFSIQDEISQQVFNELKVRLIADMGSVVVEKQLPTQDVEAYEAYLRGKELLRDRRPDEIILAIEEFKKATEFDPAFAEAFAEMSFAYARLYEYGNIDQDEVVDLIRANADKAIFIDPESPKAYSGLSSYYQIKNDTTNAITASRRAFELNPKDPLIVNSYAVTLNDYNAGNGDSLTLIAYDLDPLSPVIAGNTASYYQDRKDFKKALEILDKNIEANPDYLISYTIKIQILRNEGFGEIDEAFIQAYKGYQNNPNSMTFIAQLRRMSADFSLDSLDRFLLREVIRIFPNNPTSRVAERTLKAYKMQDLMEIQDFDEARVIAEEIFAPQIAQDREGFERFFANAANIRLFENYQDEGEFEKAFELVPEIAPEFLSDTLSVHSIGPLNTQNFRHLFELVGRQDLAEKLYLIDFEFPPEIQFMFDKDITKEDPEAVRWLALESGYNGDYDRYAEIVEELYFTRKYKLTDWESLFNDPDEIAMLENPRLKDVIDRVLADKKRMKDTVINFLREQENFKEEWIESE